MCWPSLGRDRKWIGRSSANDCRPAARMVATRAPPDPRHRAPAVRLVRPLPGDQGSPRRVTPGTTMSIVGFADRSARLMQPPPRLRVDNPGASGHRKLMRRRALYWPVLVPLLRRPGISDPVIRAGHTQSITTRRCRRPPPQASPTCSGQRRAGARPPPFPPPPRRSRAF